MQVGLFDWTLRPRWPPPPTPDAGRPWSPDVRGAPGGPGRPRCGQHRRSPAERLLGIGSACRARCRSASGAWCTRRRSAGPGVPLGDVLRRSSTRPIHIDNCARTLGQAETWRGAGREARRAVVALWGVGVGAAMAAGSTLARRHQLHQRVGPRRDRGAAGAACRCGSHGCLEAYVGADGDPGRYLDTRRVSPSRGRHRARMRRLAGARRSGDDGRPPAPSPRPRSTWASASAT